MTAAYDHLQGRDLDQVVVRVVMQVPPDLIHTEEEGKHLTFFGHDYLVAPVDRYSTSLRYAWDVVEQMRARGYHWTINSTETGVHVCFFIAGTRAFHSSTCADPAEAICRAALDALEPTP